MWLGAWRSCSPAIYVSSTDPQDAASLVERGQYACIFLSDGRYGRFIWRPVVDPPGAPFQAHMEHLYVNVGRWKP